jgi:hypothetical protein
MLRISLFLFSLYGYSQFFQKKVNIDEKLSWLASCSFIILVLYSAAYFGQLYIPALLLCLVGGILGGYYLWQKIKKGTHWLPTPNIVVILIGLYFILFIVTLLQSSLVHYDNYSHWALIVKFLYTEGQLPTAQDTIISFSSYPMGSSLFLYYATIVCGFQDNVMLFGQFVLILSSIYAMFSILWDIKNPLSVMIIFSTVSIFNYFNIAIRMNNLLVDFLLPMLTLGALAGIYRLQKQLVPLSIYTILVVGTLGIVKNSAMFFVVVVLVYYATRLVLLLRHTKNKFAVIVIGTCSIGLSLLPYFLWSIYVKQHFTESKHEVSISAYQQIFGEKNTKVLEQITQLFIKTIADIHTLSTQEILLINVILILTFCIIRFGIKRKNHLIRAWVLINSLFFVYYIGIYLMFLFSMPTEEALYLAGFDRYASSIVILALGLMSLFLAREIDYSFYEKNSQLRTYSSFKSIQTKRIYQYSILILIFFSTLMLLSENNGMLYNNKTYNQTVPATFNRVTGNRFKLNNTKYLVVSTDKDAVTSYLTGYVGKYYLYSPNVDGREDFLMDDAEFIDLLKQYDKVVILEEHYTFNAMSKKLFGRTFEPGTYKVQEIITE